SSTRSPRLLVSHTPWADTTSMGYCANTGARKSGLADAGRVAGVAGFMISLCPSGRRGREPRGPGQAEYPIHPLHSPACRALVQVIEHTHDGYGAAVRSR